MRFYSDKSLEFEEEWLKEGHGLKQRQKKLILTLTTLIL